MKTKLLLFATLFLFIFNGISQVGIRTNTPEATLDIRGQNHLGDVSSSDGVLVPRVTSLKTSGKTKGQLVFLNKDSGLLKTGFYYWDGIKWTPISNSKSTSSVSSKIYNIHHANHYDSSSLVIPNGIDFVFVNAHPHSQTKITLPSDVKDGTAIKIYADPRRRGPGVYKGVT